MMADGYALVSCGMSPIVPVNGGCWREGHDASVTQGIAYIPVPVGNHLIGGDRGQAYWLYRAFPKIFQPGNRYQGL